MGPTFKSSMSSFSTYQQYSPSPTLESSISSLNTYGQDSPSLNLKPPMSSFITYLTSLKNHNKKQSDAVTHTPQYLAFQSASPLLLSNLSIKNSEKMEVSSPPPPPPLLSFGKDYIDIAAKIDCDVKHLLLPLDKVEFFTPICYANDDLKAKHGFLGKAVEFFDSYFFLSGKKAAVFDVSSKDNRRTGHAELTEIKSTWQKIALKICSAIFTVGLLPLIMLAGKAIARSLIDYFYDAKKESNKEASPIAQQSEQLQSSPEGFWNPDKIDEIESPFKN